MIELITDSTSDLSPDLAAKLGVRVLPLTVHFGEECFRDGVDISNAGFYERLRAAETLPTTAQINPETFVDVFQEVLDRGNQAVCIFISSAMSGTCQSASIARDLLGSGDVFVVDSQTVTFSLGLLVTEAARLRDEGLTAAQLAAELTALREKLRLYAVVDTLKYLKMAGAFRRPPPWWAVCWAFRPSSPSQMAWWSRWVKPGAERPVFNGSKTGFCRKKST